MRTFILLLLASTTVQVYAQSDYLVSLKSDTLRGEVKILTYDAMDRATVKVNGKKETFTAVQVRSLFIDSMTYTPVQFEKTIRFMRVLRPGYLTLYGYRLPNQNNYDSRLLVKMNGQKLDVPNIGFKKYLS